MHHPYSMSSTSTTNSPTSHITQNNSLIAQSLLPSKYDFVGGSTALHASPTSVASSHSNHNSSLSSNTSFMSSPNNLQAPVMPYGNVKSETNSNYDYMNSCLQNSYFNSSYGAAIGGSATGGGHSVSDLTSYHHIPAAKLMATSWVDSFLFDSVDKDARGNFFFSRAPCVMREVDTFFSLF